MKKLLLSVACAFAVSALKAQTFPPSDIIIDSISWAKNAQVYEFNVSAVQLSCPYDPELLIGPVGHHNITLSSVINLADMGPGAAHFGTGNVTEGVTWDSCRGYNYYYDFCHFFLKDKHGNTLAETEKAMYDVASGQHYLSTGDPDFPQRLVWIQQFGNPDVTALNSTMDSGFTSDISPIIYEGFRDIYSKNQYGNWLNIEQILSQLVVGEPILFGIEIDPFMIDQGSNIYPDQTATWFTWDSSVPGSYHITPTTVPCSSQPLPVSVVTANNTSNTSGVMIHWDDPSGACEYKITPAYKSQNNWNSIPALSVTTSAKDYPYPYALLHSYNQNIIGTNGVVKWVFDVRAVNGNLQSTATRSTGNPVNVK